MVLYDEQELKRSSTRRSCMSIETPMAEEEEWGVKDEEELIETGLIEYRGQRRWAFDHNNVPFNILQVYIVIWRF